jgi:hypothetical protein
MKYKKVRQLLKYTNLNKIKLFRNEDTENNNNKKTLSQYRHRPMIKIAFQNML